VAFTALSRTIRAAGAAGIGLLLGCGQPADLPERQAGDRTPPTADCDATDPLRCLLPWPSNAFTAANDGNLTGLGLEVNNDGLAPSDDDFSALERADGFSTLTSVMTVFLGLLDVDDATLSGLPPDSAPMYLFKAQPNAEDYGESVPLWFEIVTSTSVSATETLLIGQPLLPLDYDSDYLAVVQSPLSADGVPLEADRRTQVAVGLEPPETTNEEAVWSYAAPQRALLDVLDIEADEVLRLWEFTTRSEQNAVARLETMIDHALEAEAIVDDGSVTVEWFDDDTDRLGVVQGEVIGVPDFLTETGLATDEEGNPTAHGTRNAPFRFVLPDGVDEAPIVLFGHGTGGDVTDSSFDEEIATEGFVKLNVQFDGWDESQVGITLGGLSQGIAGAEWATSALMQSIVGAAIVLDLLPTGLTTLLAQAEIAGTENPAAELSLETENVQYLGGSLGGVMGALLVATLDPLDTGVLNVPPGAWTQMIPSSFYFTDIIEPIATARYRDEIEVRQMIVMTQGIWDEVDSAIWASRTDAILLVQESVGDPIVPNLASELLARSLNATRVAGAITELWGFDNEAETVIGASAFTQFKVLDKGDAYQVHGFAARDTEAGKAARAQILHFIQTAADGTPEIITPEACLLNGGNCDFSEAGRSRAGL
jgi:hypothetical protein